MARAVQHMRAVLAAGDAVHQNDQRPVGLRLGRPVEHAHQNVTAAIGHAKTHALAAVRRQVGLVGAEQHRDRLQVRAPPRKARLEGRQFEGIDGRGHVGSVFTVRLSMKTPVPSQSSALLGVAYAVGAAAVFSTAGVIVRRIDLPAWDVSFWRSALLVATMLPLLFWQRRGVLDRRSQCGPRPSVECAAAGRQLRRLHPGAGPRPGRQCAADVRRHAVHHRPARAPLPRRAAARPYDPHHGGGRAGPCDQRGGLAAGRRARRHGGGLHRRAVHERQLRRRASSP